MYDVVLLIEQPLTDIDADQVTSLHEAIEEPVRYRVLMPVTDASARIETAMGSLAASEVLAPPAVVLPDVDIEKVQREVLEQSKAELEQSVAKLADRGRDASGDVTTRNPVDALAEEVKRLSAAESIILTRPHVVAEFFHLDWTSRARRRLGVPCLHLLEAETFAEQGSGGGEGAPGAVGG